MSTSLVSALSFAGLVGVVIIQRAGGVVPGWVPVLIIVVGTFAFAAGVSPIPFIVLTEMFNFQVNLFHLFYIIISGQTHLRILNQNDNNLLLVAGLDAWRILRKTCLGWYEF